MPARTSDPVKRSDYRIPLKLSQSIQVGISFTAGQSYQAELQDISISGASLLLPEVFSALPAGEKLVSCEISLDGEEVLSCEAVVRRHHRLPSTKAYSLGIEFRRLSASGVRKLRRMLMTLQRHNIKNYLQT